jgi:threonine/homoserine/homoserine lactone efflux protein
MTLHFFYGLLGSFIGGIAFGPLNLTVVDITLRRSMQHAARFSAAAALIEIGQAAIAVLFGKLIGSKLDEWPQLKVVVVVFFVLLGLYFLLKKERPESAYDGKGKGSFFVKGLILASLNPQAIPYWIFVLAYLTSIDALALQSWNFPVFLAGVCIGKYLILSVYGLLSEYIRKRTRNLSKAVSKTIGIILICIGFYQAWRFFA